MSSSDEFPEVRPLDMERLAVRLAWIVDARQITHLVLTDEGEHKPGWIVNAQTLPSLLRSLADVVEKRLGDTVVPGTADLIAAVRTADELDPLRYQAVGVPELLNVAGLQASLVEKIDAGTQLVYALYHVHGEDQLDWLKAAPDPVHRANARAQAAYGVGRRSRHAGTEPS